MSKAQNWLLIAGLVSIASLSTYTYLEKQKMPSQWYTAQQVAKGKPLYAMHCSACHGDMGQGAEQWTKRNADGQYPAPPLNGSGHAWHHSLAQLTHTVTHGQGAMPAFGNTLTQAQIEATIAWTQSLWQKPIYDAWERQNDD